MERSRYWRLREIGTEEDLRPVSISREKIEWQECLRDLMTQSCSYFLGFFFKHLCRIWAGPKMIFLASGKKRWWIITMKMIYGSKIRYWGSLHEYERRKGPRLTLHRTCPYKMVHPMNTHSTYIQAAYLSHHGNCLIKEISVALFFICINWSGSIFKLLQYYSIVP